MNYDYYDNNDDINEVMKIMVSEKDHDNYCDNANANFDDNDDDDMIVTMTMIMVIMMTMSQARPSVRETR